MLAMLWMLKLVSYADGKWYENQMRFELDVLGLPAVNQSHVQCVAQYEFDLVLGAPIGQLVLRGRMLQAYDLSVAKRCDHSLLRLGPGQKFVMQHDLAVFLENAREHLLGKPVDPAVEFPTLCKEPHHGPPELTSRSHRSATTRIDL